MLYNDLSLIFDYFDLLILDLSLNGVVLRVQSYDFETTAFGEVVAWNWRITYKQVSITWKSVLLSILNLNKPFHFVLLITEIEKLTTRLYNHINFIIKAVHHNLEKNSAHIRRGAID